MTWATVILFATSAILLTNVLISYGGLLPIVKRLPDAPIVLKSGQVPTTTVIMTALNEEDQIVAKVDNLLERISELAEPEKVDVVLVDDGSVDSTSTLASQYPIELIRNKERMGVARSIDRALSGVNTDIVVLTDVGTELAPLALDSLLRPFGDPSVGTVTGVVQFARRSDELAGGFSRFWEYEVALRTEMSRAGVLATASGALMAFRRRDAPSIPTAFAGDCFVPLASISEGRRTIQADGAIALDPGTGSVENERAARTRMVARNLSCIRHFARGPLPIRGNLLVRMVLFFHKTVRWYAAPIVVAAGGLFVGGLALASPTLAFLLAAIALLGLLSIGVFGDQLAVSFPLLGTLYGLLLVQLAFVRGIRDSFTSTRHMIYEKSG